MLIASNLPTNLWPEAWTTASYLYNRTPRERNHWKSPLQALEDWLLKNDPLYPTPRIETRPDWSGIYAFGCRAYPLQRDYQAGNARTWYKTHPRAHIGYLVGYKASNIYRIWVPALNEVITSRDVTFDERRYFSPEEERLAEETTEYEPLARSLHIPDIAEPEIFSGDTVTEDTRDNIQENPAQGPTVSSNKTSTSEQTTLTSQLLTPDPEPVQGNDEDVLRDPAPGAESQRVEAMEPHSTIIVRTEQEIGTPDATPSTETDHLQATELQEEHQTRRSQRQINPTQRAIESRQQRRVRTRNKSPNGDQNDTARALLLAAFFTVTMHAVFEAGTAIKGPLISTLPPEPSTWEELETHPYGPQFLEAAKKEIDTWIKMRAYDVVLREEAKGARILPLKWVFKYKVDSEGHLLKCKARVCIRGDLQPPTYEDTRAATLAVRTFRLMMAIMARFDLEAKQFDVNGAFLHTLLPEDEQVYCELPQGFKQPGRIARLLRALYGLRRSPLLWYETLAKALEEIGLTRCTEEPCLYKSDKIWLLFYVDDFIILYRKEDEQEFQRISRALNDQFDIREEGELDWFLGIAVIRNRTRRCAYLSQYAYIERVAKKYRLTEGNTWPDLPISPIEFEPAKAQATPQEVLSYQEKIGSILYCAIMTRPDVAYAVSQLSKYLQNPTREHQTAANQVIRYIYKTRYLALRYGSETEALVIAGDASYADDPETRYSSQGYIILLFGGPVVWKASRQTTVTTSTTEAELLALTTTAKEAMALDRLMKDITLNLNAPLTILCDNLQTIRLVVGENERIATKLRHVDIHNLWARQEHRKGTFSVEYLPSKDMPADGLTKALNRVQFERFRGILNFANVEHHIDNTKGAPYTQQQ